MSDTPSFSNKNLSFQNDLMRFIIDHFSDLQSDINLKYLTNVSNDVSNEVSKRVLNKCIKVSNKVK